MFNCRVIIYRVSCSFSILFFQISTMETLQPSMLNKLFYKKIQIICEIVHAFRYFVISFLVQIYLFAIIFWSRVPNIVQDYMISLVSFIILQMQNTFVCWTENTCSIIPFAWTWHQLIAPVKQLIIINEIRNPD